MSKFSNNLTPSLLLEAQTATPALTNATGAMVAGQFRLFIEDGVMKLVDYQGNVTSQFPEGATGTIYYQAADGSIATLPIGTNGQFLSILDGLPAWVEAPSGGGGDGDPTDALLTGTVIGSTPYSDMYALAHAFDGDTTSQYAGSGTSGQYIGMDFGTNKTVVRCSIWPRPGSASMPDAQIQTSTDGSTWANSGQVCPSSIPDGTYTTFTFTSPVVTRYLRILGLEGSRADCCEIQFIGH